MLSILNRVFGIIVAILAVSFLSLDEITISDVFMMIFLTITATLLFIDAKKVKEIDISKRRKEGKKERKKERKKQRNKEKKK